MWLYLLLFLLFVPKTHAHGHGVRHLDVFQVFKNVEFNSDIRLTLKVHESECHDPSTDSAFTIYLGSLTFDNRLSDLYPISSDDVKEYDEKNGIWTFKIIIHEEQLGHRTKNETKESMFYPLGVFSEDTESCFQNGNDPCIPRADVVFVQYEEFPISHFSISHITVDVDFRLWVGQPNLHTFHYEHIIMMPCESMFAKQGVWQMGPRSGLIVKLMSVPKKGDWIRNWV